MDLDRNIQMALKHARHLHSEACRQITSKYKKPFLTNGQYKENIGKFSELAGSYHAIVRLIMKK